MPAHTQKEKSTAKGSANIVYLITALLILLIGIIFALQNPESTNVKFLFWEYEGSRAIVLFLTFFMGIVIGIFISIANLMRKDRIISKQVNQIRKLEEDNEK
jgi:uncharacterized integral membrane protein